MKMIVRKRKKCAAARGFFIARLCFLLRRKSGFHVRVRRHGRLTAEARLDRMSKQRSLK